MRENTNTSSSDEAATSIDTAPQAETPVEAITRDEPIRLLSRQEILDADDLKYEDVPVPEWKSGAFVRVRSLRARDKDRFEVLITKGDAVDVDNIRAKLCALTIVDAHGNRLFTDEDIEALGDKSASALSRVYSKAAQLNRLSDKDLEELAKNSGRGRSVVSL